MRERGFDEKRKEKREEELGRNEGRYGMMKKKSYREEL